MCIFLMLIGVVVFSLTAGSLSSIITSYDSRESYIKEKIATLNQICDEYNVDMDTFNRLVKSIKYDHSKKQKDVISFMEELPRKLKLELSLIMINQMYANVVFFRDKDKSFIAWIARLINPLNMEESDYIYKEGEEIAESKQTFIFTFYSILPEFGSRRICTSEIFQQSLPHDRPGLPLRDFGLRPGPLLHRRL